MKSWHLLKFSANDTTKSASDGADDKATQHVRDTEQRTRRRPTQHTAIHQLKY